MNYFIYISQKGNCKKKYALYKQKNCTLQTKKNLTVKKVHTTRKRITRCKQNSRTLQTRKKLYANKTHTVSFLFAVCGSFVCSVREFCLQCAILLLVVCIFFFYSFLFVCSVLELIFFQRVLYVCKDFL